VVKPAAASGVWASVAAELMASELLEVAMDAGSVKDAASSILDAEMSVQRIDSKHS
jgi:hypothetical protein